MAQASQPERDERDRYRLASYGPVEVRSHYNGDQTLLAIDVEEGPTLSAVVDGPVTQSEKRGLAKRAIHAFQGVQA